MSEQRHPVHVVRHGPLRLRLRRNLDQLQALFDGHSFWACGRSHAELHRMLSGSSVVVSAWVGSRLVGFGRATTDGVFRAVLWDVVVDQAHQGRGLGRRVVETLLGSATVAAAQRVYLMTSRSAPFYGALGFDPVGDQQLMRRSSPERGSGRASG